MLLYIAITARLDIATAISTAGRFSHYSGSLDISKLLTDTQSHSVELPRSAVHSHVTHNRNIHSGHSPDQQ
jgi:hypothetical protein